MSDGRLSSGIRGFDEVLEGGFIPGRSYLLSGPPGTGKTTLGWHFLTEGAGKGEPALFITFGESQAELRRNAESSGFDLTNVHFIDLSPSSDVFAQAESYDVFSPAEVEREPLVRTVVETVRSLKPTRIFIDSMSYLRYVAGDNSQFRKQTISFLRYLIERGAVVLMTSESSAVFPDDDLRFLSDGVIELALGDRTRTLSISKFRGSDFRHGKHALTLSAQGATVFPRLVPASHQRSYDDVQLHSGIAQLDSMLGGGVERGTVTLLTGPSGVGKTTLGIQFMKEAAERGDRTAIYTFDENRETLLRRAEATNTQVRAMIDRGTLVVTEIEALQYGPDEFANMVRRDVEEYGTRIVMIDSVSGYRLSVAGDDLQSRIHALCKYLQNVGVTTFLINELQDLNDFRISETNISYLSDNIIYLRYMERDGAGHARLGRGLGVLKKRLSDFDKGLYDFEIASSGIEVGRPLPSFGGILPPVRIDTQ